jgi:hypothetical protein
MKTNPAQVRLPRVTKGKRPHFFADPAGDQMMTFILELMAEFSVLRDRLDTIERLLEQNDSIRREDIEAYTGGDAVEAERAARRQAFIERVLRMHASDGR